jgi:transcription-repair coupling factor (superfamily II helicase)
VPQRDRAQAARRRSASSPDLGAGFRSRRSTSSCAAPGNLLGGQQSGHIQAVGLDLYVKLLEQAILELRGEPPRELPRARCIWGRRCRIPPGLRAGDSTSGCRSTSA